MRSLTFSDRCRSLLDKLVSQGLAVPVEAGGWEISQKATRLHSQWASARKTKGIASIFSFLNKSPCDLLLADAVKRRLLRTVLRDAQSVVLRYGEEWDDELDLRTEQLSSKDLWRVLPGQNVKDLYAWLQYGAWTLCAATVVDEKSLAIDRDSFISVDGVPEGFDVCLSAFHDNDPWTIRLRE